MCLRKRVRSRRLCRSNFSSPGHLPPTHLIGYHRGRPYFEREWGGERARRPFAGAGGCEHNALSRNIHPPGSHFSEQICRCCLGSTLQVYVQNGDRWQPPQLVIPAQRRPKALPRDGLASAGACVSSVHIHGFLCFLYGGRQQHFIYIFFSVLGRCARG